MAGPTLRFRRHLALCALLLFVHELYLAGQAEFGGARRRRLAAAAATTDSAQEPIGDSGGQVNLATAMVKRASSSFQQNQTANGSPMNDDDDDSSPLSNLLARISHYLPTLNFNFTIVGKQFDNGQLDWEVEQYYEERFPRNGTLDQLHLLSIKAAIRMAPIPLHTSWGYESIDELRASSWPVRDESRCAAHLGQLNQRLDRLSAASASAPDLAGASANGVGLPEVTRAAAHEATPVENFEAQAIYRSTDVLFARYLDTFGKVPSDLLRGNVRWYGSHSGCLNTKLAANQQLGGTKRIKFRYCMAALKSKAWPSGNGTRHRSASMSMLQASNDGAPLRRDYGSSLDIPLENFFIRVGTCLPESCDSSALDYLENTRIIERLIKFNLMKPFNSDHYYLADLYCLPDDRSPLRSIPLLGKLLILAALAWMALIGAATTIHLNVERFYTKAVREIRARQEEERSGLRRSASKGKRPSLDNNEFRESDILQLKRNWIRLNVYLFDKSKRSIEGVDLIACLSLYSNWLKYTRRLKLAIAQLNTDEERRERLQVRHQQLVDAARQIGATSGQTVQLAEATGGERKRIDNMTNVKGLMDSVGAGDKTPLSGANSESRLDERNLADGTGAGVQFGFNDELNKRIIEQDEMDELDSETFKRRVDTSSLNALKVIALVWIIAGHCIFYLGSTVSNGAILMNYARDLSAFALANGALYITELFFVITGCLTAYLAFKYNTLKPNGEQVIADADSARTNGELGKQQSSQLQEAESLYLESRMFKIQFWIKIVINRYMRILPTYLLVYSFVKLVSVYVGGSGQIWDYAVSPNSMRRRCVQESWLPVLTLTSNFVDVYSHCLVGGWYLSVDMQFMVMAVPLLIMMAHCQRRGTQTKSAGTFVTSFADKQRRTEPVGQQLTFMGDSSARNSELQGGQQPQGKLKNQIVITKRICLAYLVLLGTALLSISLAIYCGLIWSQVDLSYILKFVPHTVAVLSQNITMYTNSLFRLRAFAFGLILGHLLYLYEFKLIKLPKFVQQHGAKLTTTIFVVGFGIMFLPAIYPKSKLIVSHDMIALLMILTASAMDITLCTLIFLVCVGKAPKAVLFFLNSPFWTVLSSLSLCAFLVHSEVIVLLTSQLNPPPTCQYSLLLFVFSATLLITYMLALGLYLSFEMPFSRLVDAIMRKYFMNSASVRSDSTLANSSQQAART